MVGRLPWGWLDDVSCGPTLDYNCRFENWLTLYWGLVSLQTRVSHLLVYLMLSGGIIMQINQNY